MMMDNKMIHKLTGLSNEGCKPVNEKNVKKLVEINLKTKSDGRNMRIDLVAEADVRIIGKIIGYKPNQSSRMTFVPIGFIHATYLMIVKKENVNMWKIVKQQLLDNSEKLKRTKNTVFRFESLLTHILSVNQTIPWYARPGMGQQSVL